MPYFFISTGFHHIGRNLFYFGKHYGFQNCSKCKQINF